MNDSAPTTTQDHRLKRRKTARSTLRLQARRGTMGLGKNLALEVIDINEDGIGFHASEELKQGEDLELILTKPGVNRILKMVGEVRWCCQLPEEEEDEAPAFLIGVKLRNRIAYADLTTYY
jgi:hypothetical protein